MPGRLTPPPYFALIREKARARWDQLEADPELAGPWHQLFRQVQSPRHVLSELLQNADDVGAERAAAYIQDGQFVFEHDGHDFSEGDFKSLCSFGFSNKRSLHTIGFRGIGFKSTFSLGPEVKVVSPSLSVAFRRKRFTEPVWVEDAHLHDDKTVVAVAIKPESREEQLRKNLDDWVASAASLLFFRSIERLDIGGSTVRKRRLGKGHAPRSERIRLEGAEQQEVLLIRSPPEPFPEEALQEVREERGDEALDLPPCTVEIVLGLPGPQRLFVVLPTVLEVDLPFSCNAPFIQDPARTGIKDPATSPTNRWLLERVGRLAAETMLAWLRQSDLDPAQRAQAYCLLTAVDRDDRSAGGIVATVVEEALGAALDGQRFLLTIDGRLAQPDTVIALPDPIYDVWAVSHLKHMLGGEKDILAADVSDDTRERLAHWGWGSSCTPDEILSALRSGKAVKKPDGWRSLLTLWQFVDEYWVRYRWQADRNEPFAIIPVEGQDCLSSGGNVVRLGEDRAIGQKEDWEFLAQHILVMDRLWTRFLSRERRAAEEAKDEARAEQVEAAYKVLDDLGLKEPSNADTVMARAASRFFSGKQVKVADCIRFAHIAAALGAKPGDAMKFLACDQTLHSPSDGIVTDPAGHVRELAPDEWAETHVLDDRYFKKTASCSPKEWLAWAQSEKSGLWSFAPLCKQRDLIGGRERLDKVLRSRHVGAPADYPYVTSQFYLDDHDFGRDLVVFWEKQGKEDLEIWAKVVRSVLEAPPWFWRNRTHATVSQVATTGNEKDVGTMPIPAAWIARLQSVVCLPDTNGILHVPAELLLRTPETEPLMGVEPFVLADLDTDATRPLLKLLSVRDSPSGVGKLLERIAALATLEEPLPHVHEVIKWYEALDRVLARCCPENLKEAKEAFVGKPLILTQDGQWAAAHEVFQTPGDDEVPDAQLVHQSARALPMWLRLGVAERPTLDLVLGWLRGLKSGGKLDPQVARRVRAALTRHPQRIWQECGHWLSLDSAWSPVEDLEFRLTMQGLVKWGDLFPKIKNKTADLQMLAVDVCQQAPFGDLQDLGAAIVYRVTERRLASPIPKPWLTALGEGLSRVKLTDDAETQHVRAVAVRLARSQWQPFHVLRVVPYVDGTPAGQPHNPDVLWQDEMLYVRTEKMVRLFNTLAAEISRPFANFEIEKAVRACIEREGTFVADYLEANFNLDSAPTGEKQPVASPSQSGGTTKDEQHEQPGEDPTAGGADTKDEPAKTDIVEPGEVVEPEPSPLPPRPPHPQPPTLIQRYTKVKGFRWEGEKQRYVHRDGRWIEQSEGSFNWECHAADGGVLRRLWVNAQCLDRGVEVAADLWEMVKQAPAVSAFVLIDEKGEPQEFSGEQLLALEAKGLVTLFPAKYRIRKSTKATL